MLRVGLTGGIACGKSRCVRRLAAAGLPTLDLDRVAHELDGAGAARPHDDVVAAFGARDPRRRTGAIDRRALGAIVFADPAARAAPERASCIRACAPRRPAAPAARRRSGGRRARHRRRPARRGGDAPALRPSGGGRTAGPTQQIARLRARDGLPKRRRAPDWPRRCPSRRSAASPTSLVDTSRVAPRTRAGPPTPSARDPRRSWRATAPRPVVVAEARALGVPRLRPGARAARPDARPSLAEPRRGADGLDLGALAAIAPARGRGALVRGGGDARGRRRRRTVAAPALAGARSSCTQLRPSTAPIPSRLAAAAFSLAWLTERDGSRIASSRASPWPLARSRWSCGRSPRPPASSAAVCEPLERGGGPVAGARALL